MGWLSVSVAQRQVAAILLANNNPIWSFSSTRRESHSQGTMFASCCRICQCFGYAMRRIKRHSRPPSPMESHLHFEKTAGLQSFSLVLQRRSTLPVVLYTHVGGSGLLNGWTRRQTHLCSVQTALGARAPLSLHMQAWSFTLGSGLLLGPCIEASTVVSHLRYSSTFSRYFLSAQLPASRTT